MGCVLLQSTRDWGGSKKGMGVQSVTVCVRLSLPHSYVIITAIPRHSLTLIVSDTRQCDFYDNKCTKGLQVQCLRFVST